jgi:hypothetical protein
VAKMNWDRVNIENLDYRHKNEIERIEEEKVSFTDSPAEHKCPHCELKVSDSKYRFHFAESHFLRTGTVSTVILLLARIGSNCLILSAIAPCVLNDILKLLRANFGFDQDYSPEEIANKLRREDLRFTVETVVIGLSGEAIIDVKRIANDIQGVATRIHWGIGWRYKHIPLALKTVRLDEAFLRAMRKELRGEANRSNGNTKRKKPKKKRKSSQLKPQ